MRKRDTTSNKLANSAKSKTMTGKATRKVSMKAVAPVYGLRPQKWGNLVWGGVEWSRNGYT